MRYAIYFIPPHSSPLERFGCSVIGSSAYSGARCHPLRASGIAAEELATITEEPRRYGFHATLKAPMRLSPAFSEADLLRELRGFCAPRAPVVIGRLEVALFGGFIALRPSSPSPALDLLAAECVASFDHFREPMGPEEQARRAAGLSPRQIALLDRWGYPYVFDEFRFHMTLTGRLPVERRQAWLERLGQAFGGLGRETVIVDALCLLRQDAPDSPFRVVERIPFAFPAAA